MALDQARLFHARERKKAIRGFSDLHATHVIHGTSSMAVAQIDIDRFDREVPVTFQTRIRIAAGVSQGLIFQFGSATRGLAAWVEPNMIGITAGLTASNIVTAVWDLGAALATDREFQLMFAVIPGLSRARIWHNGNRVANDVDPDLGAGGWADANDGSLAAVPFVSVPTSVPVASRIAPSNFAVIEPLTVFAGQFPMNLV